MGPFIGVPENNYVSDVRCDFSSGSCGATVTNTRTGNVLYEY